MRGEPVERCEVERTPNDKEVVECSSRGRRKQTLFFFFFPVMMMRGKVWSQINLASTYKYSSSQVHRSSLKTMRSNCQLYRSVLSLLFSLNYFQHQIFIWPYRKWWVSQWCRVLCSSYLSTVGFKNKQTNKNLFLGHPTTPTFVSPLDNHLVGTNDC